MKVAIRTMSLAALFMAQFAVAGQPVNVNTASAQELAAALDGIGLSRAEAIVDYRTANGPFRAADDLANVKGVGSATLTKNRKNILVSDSETPADAR